MIANIRRSIGLVLCILVVLPVYRLLEGRETGLAGQTTIELSDVHTSLLWAGTALVLVPALFAARLLRPGALERPLARLGGVLASFHPVGYAGALALFAGALTLLFALFVLDGKPNLIDAMSQLLHARYLAEGRLAGPTSPLAEFWHIQVTIPTPRGWVSHFPPGHTILLALGFRLGVVWAVGPALVAVTVFFTALTAERLLPQDRAVARLGALLVALSPFLICLAAAYMNHITAAAFASVAGYTALRARDGHWSWAVLAGAAAGAMFATRPLSGLVIGSVLTIGVWLTGSNRGPLLPRAWAARLAAAFVGALPFGLALAFYNAHFFGSPFRFGYVAAQGPSVGPGFHRDPWGNVYGPIEALAYTSSDLVALSLYLLETPIPLVAVVGFFLLFAKRLSPGERLIAAWALLPVVANFFYWHHGLFMGPRMLNEAAPAWGLLAAVVGVGLVRRVPARLSLMRRTYSPRAGVATALLLGAAAGFAYLGPQRVLGYRQFMPSSRVEPPQTPFPSIVFVHEGWGSRVAMRLAAHGMRLDSVETALRQNSTCDVHAYARVYAENRGRADVDGLPQVDFTPRASGLPELVEVFEGNRIRMWPGDTLTAECRREIHADRLGIFNFSALVWQRDLPGLPARGAMLVRDFGPEHNAKLIALYPERRPYVWLPNPPDSVPRLVPYDSGMSVIWGTAGAPLD